MIFDNFLLGMFQMNNISFIIYKLYFRTLKTYGFDLSLLQGAVTSVVVISERTLDLCVVCELHSLRETRTAELMQTVTQNHTVTRCAPTQTYRALKLLRAGDQV